MKPISSSFVAVVCIIGCLGLTIYIFAASRNDPGLRMAALVSSTSVAAALIAIASTLLVGHDVTKPDPSELPPGSISAHSDSIQVPPITPEVK